MVVQQDNSELKKTLTAIKLRLVLSTLATDVKDGSSYVEEAPATVLKP